MVHIKILITAFLMVLFLYGCGASNPGGTANPSAKPLGALQSVSVSLSFPTQSTNAPAALISAQTQSFNINIYSVPAYNKIGHAVVVKPVGGGLVSSSIELTPYTGSAAVMVAGYDGPDPTRANAKSWVWQDMFIPANQQTIPVSMTVIEYGQGALIPAGTQNSTLLSPDGTAYTITSVYLDTNDVVRYYGDYILGVNTSFTTVAGASTTAFSSLNCLNPLSWLIDPYIVNGQTWLDIEIPNASRTVWNNYTFYLNFNNGPNGTPTNAPTIQTSYWGTYMLNASGAIVAAPVGVYSTPAPGILLNASASWINNVAPPHASQAVILFYTQPQQQGDKLTSKLNMPNKLQGHR